MQITIDEEQRRLLRQLLSNAWHDLNQARMLSRPGSPEERGYLEDQQSIELLQAALKNVTPPRQS